MENDKINCGVCYEDLESKQFKILNCLHKICNQCHTKLIKLECPFCRTPFDKVESVLEINTIQNSTNLQNQLSALEIEYDGRLERRRRRRERRRNNRNSRHRSSDHQLLGVFYIDDDINSDDEILIRQRSQPITINKNKNTHNNKSNRWNDLNRQRQFPNSY